MYSTSSSKVQLYTMKLIQTLFVLYSAFLLSNAIPVDTIDQQVLGTKTEQVSQDDNSLDLEPVIDDAKNSADVLVGLQERRYYDFGRRNEEVLKELLNRGAEVNALDHYGRTALHQAVTRGQKTTVVELLRSGADITAQDYGGRTPLHLAVASGRLDVVIMLLEKGADINARDNEGKTPLQLAATDEMAWAFNWI
jgi:ankyrin repeat protein